MSSTNPDANAPDRSDVTPSTGATSMPSDTSYKDVSLLEPALTRSRFKPEDWCRFAGCGDEQFHPAVGPSKQVRGWCIDSDAYEQRYQLLCHHVATTPKMKDLQDLYPREYNSYRSRKQSGAFFAPVFRDFRNWLVHLGPRPEPGWTVDNIKCSGKQGYRPGNVRWLCKRGQRRNQKRVRGLVTLPDGRRCTVKKLARLSGKKPNTVSQQLRRGWSVERILEDSEEYKPVWAIPSHMTALIAQVRKRRRPGESQLDCCIRITRENLADPSFQRVADTDGLAAVRAQLQWLEQEAASIRKHEQAERARIASEFIDEAKRHTTWAKLSLGVLSKPLCNEIPVLPSRPPEVLPPPDPWPDVPDTERWPTLEEQIAMLTRCGHAGLAEEIRERCAVAEELGLPCPYPLHPHYRWPHEKPKGIGCDQISKVIKARHAAAAENLSGDQSRTADEEDGRGSEEPPPPSTQCDPE